MLGLALLTLLALGCGGATTAPTTAPETAGTATPAEAATDRATSSTEGTIYHYRKSNHDGGQIEQMALYVPAPDRFEAFFFIAGKGQAELVVGTLAPHGRWAETLEIWARYVQGHGERLARLETRLGADGRPRELHAEVEPPADLRVNHPALAAVARGAQTLPLTGHPPHIYAFDLVTLMLALRQHDAATPLTVTLVQPTFQPQPPYFETLGEITLTDEGEEMRLDQPCRRYRVAGEALGPDGGGHLWLHRDTRVLIEAVLGRANNPQWRNLRLVFERSEPSDAAGWQRVQQRAW
ncbi:MAG: hypothetical protein AAF772_03680 [Acidobacteriota bacterium]